MFLKRLFSKNKNKTPISKIDYDYYFQNSSHGDVNLGSIRLGDLNVTSGNIIVADPLVNLYDTDALNLKINPGKYPVIVCTATHEDFGERYAFVKLLINEDKVLKWELAYDIRLKDKIDELGNDEYFGFPVDAGLGCFCDKDTQKLYKLFIDNYSKDNPESNIYDDYFAEKFKQNAKNFNDPNDIGDWLNWNIPGTENNIIMFHSGFGDGYYPVYWGLNTNNKISSIMIDFQIFGDD